MTSLTTTAATLELTAMMSAAPAIPDARSSRAGWLVSTLGAAVLALWLAATVAVLTGRWQPPVPAEVSGWSGIAVGQAG